MNQDDPKKTNLDDPLSYDPDEYLKELLDEQNQPGVMAEPPVDDTEKPKKKKFPWRQVWQWLAYLLPAAAIIFAGYLLITYPALSFRWILIAILAGIYLLCTFLAILFQIKKMAKAQITMIVITLLFTGLVSGLDYLYYRLTSMMDRVSTSEGEIITSTLYVLSDSTDETLTDLKSKAIAVQPENSVTMYDMLVTGIEEAKMEKSDFVLTPYANYVEAYNAFQDGKVDAIVLDALAKATIREVYPDFDQKVKEITTFYKITENTASNIDVATEPFTLLINGVDVRDGDLNEAANADVIMLATFNPNTMKLALHSIPRDTYLPVTCRGYEDKITHSGGGGVSCTISSLEDAFDIDIDYYVKINFFALIDLVNALGGIDVDVPMEFDEQDSHDEKNAIHLDPGYQHLDGEQALALARHRYSLPRGDIDRGLNQQLVIEAILHKVASSAGIMSVDKLLSVVGDNVQTNMPVSQMYSLFQMLTSLNTDSKYGDLSALNISMKTIDGTDDMHVPPYNSEPVYFYLPYEYSMQEFTRDIRRMTGEESYPLPTATFAFNANVQYDELSDDAKYYLDNDEPEDLSYETPEDETYSPPYVPDFSGQTLGDVAYWCSGINSELPEGYEVSCEYYYEDGTWAEDDSALFSYGDFAAWSELSPYTLYEGTTILPFYFTYPYEDEYQEEPGPYVEEEPYEEETYEETEY